HHASSPAQIYTLSYTTLFRSPECVQTPQGSSTRHRSLYIIGEDRQRLVEVSLLHAFIVGHGHAPQVRHSAPLSLPPARSGRMIRSEEHTSELQSRENLVCRLL